MEYTNNRTPDLKNRFISVILAGFEGHSLYVH